MIPPVPLPAPAHLNTDLVLRRKAIELEGQFLAEMLRHAGVGQTPQSFGGGIGEEQMSSFLREAQANAIARRGGIGLAETLFRALKGRQNAGD